MHGGADGGTEVFDGGEAAVDGLAHGVRVLEFEARGGGGGEGWGEHGCDFAEFGVGADEVVFGRAGGGSAA